MCGQRFARHEVRFGMCALRGARIVRGRGQQRARASTFQSGPIYAMLHERRERSTITARSPTPCHNDGGRMNAQLRRRLEMAGRVRDFLRAHKTDAVGEGLGLAKLEELIARAEALDAQQRAGIVTTRLSTKHREGLRRALQSKLLLYLRALGGLGDPENGEAAVQFQVPPSNASHVALLTAGRDMLEKATGQKDVLLSRGMPPTLLDDLAGALGGLEKTIESTRAGRRDHVGASADLETVAAEIKKQVRALDGMVRYRFGDNAELMGAWRSARNVLGPFKTKNEPEAGGSQTPKAA